VCVEGPRSKKEGRESSLLEEVIKREGRIIARGKGTKLSRKGEKREKAPMHLRGGRTPEGFFVIEREREVCACEGKRREQREEGGSRNCFTPGGMSREEREEGLSPCRREGDPREKLS